MKIRHLKRSEDFKRISRQGEKYRGKTLTLAAETPDENESGLVVGVVAPRKAASDATVRNYVKRAIYGFFRREKESYVPGAKVVVSLARNIDGDTRNSLSAEVQKELKELSKEAGLTRR